MRTLLKTICESAFTNSENGNLNIIGIFEHVNARQFPATHPKMTFVLIAEGEPNRDTVFSFDIADDTGNVIVDKKGEAKSAKFGPNGKINLIFNVVNINLPKAGKYAVNLYVDGVKESIGFEARLITGGLA